MDDHPPESPSFEVEVDDIDGWVSEDNIEGWEDLSLDDEMMNILDEIENERTQIDENELDRFEDQENEEETIHNDADAANLKQYLKENQNQNTIKKTELSMKKFRYIHIVNLTKK